MVQLRHPTIFYGLYDKSGSLDSALKQTRCTMSCDFCAEISAPRTAKSRIAYDNGAFVAMPTLGCFVDGYTLVLPKKHVPSFAALDQEASLAGAAVVEKTRAALEKLYGRCIVAEHGAADGCSMGAGCCDHAHVHVIPLGDKSERVLEEYRATGGKEQVAGDWRQLAGFTGLPYLMLSTEPGVYRIWAATPQFHRQFVRRVAAGLVDKVAWYNWREFHFVPGMVRTKVALDVLLR